MSTEIKSDIAGDYYDRIIELVGRRGRRASRRVLLCFEKPLAALLLVSHCFPTHRQIACWQKTQSVAFFSFFL